MQNSIQREREREGGRGRERERERESQRVIVYVCSKTSGALLVWPLFGADHFLLCMCAL
jgi:hypothetical protein